MSKLPTQAGSRCTNTGIRIYLGAKNWSFYPRNFLSYSARFCLFGPPGASLQLSDQQKIQLIALLDTSCRIQHLSFMSSSSCMLYVLMNSSSTDAEGCEHSRCKFEID